MSPTIAVPTAAGVAYEGVLAAVRIFWRCAQNLSAISARIGDERVALRPDGAEASRRKYHARRGHEIAAILPVACHQN